jgi:hypothetical protein
MSYPDSIIASLVEIGGTSCGTIAGRLDWNSGAPTPQYDNVSGESDFSIARCTRVDLGGGQYTWELRLRYTGGGPCNGTHTFRRTVAADDPTGDYCKYVSGQINCNAGKAGVTEYSFKAARAKGSKAKALKSACVTRRASKPRPKGRRPGSRAPRR